jgi:hypothetical protein
MPEFCAVAGARDKKLRPAQLAEPICRFAARLA